MQQKSPLRIGIAGLGTVGIGTLETLERNAEIIAARCGREIIVTAVSARDAQKDRGVDLSGITFHTDPLALVQDNRVDVIVEVMGGSEGPARALVEAAITAGKPVVTANKALLAKHGKQLAESAEKKKVPIAFECAVAGGIPVIKVLREGLAANRITRITGILNATCNVILTTMRDQQRELGDVMEEAAKLGLLEADPSLDIDGIDASHKISLLAALAFGTAPALDHVYCEGIRNVSLRDMQYAEKLGYVIKLLAIASAETLEVKTPIKITQRVHPCLVPKRSRIGQVSGAFNAVALEGDACGYQLFEGLGGGKGPTASAILGDVMDIADGTSYPPFTVPSSALKSAEYVSMQTLSFAYYLRVAVNDRAGILADVTQLLKEENISIRTFLQEEHRAEDAAELVITTHTAGEAAMQRAVAKIEALPAVQGKPTLIRIEAL